jgi:hypothetical protein
MPLRFLPACFIAKSSVAKEPNMPLAHLSAQNMTEAFVAATARSEAADLRADLGVFVLPPVLGEERVADDETRVNSEGYTSRIYQCCY